MFYYHKVPQDNTRRRRLYRRKLVNLIILLVYFYFLALRILPIRLSEPLSSVDSVADLRNGGRWSIPGSANILSDSHCDRIYSSLAAVRCFDNGYVGKQQVVRKEYCAEYWLKELHKSMDRCTLRRDITEILLKTLKTPYNQSINHSPL